MCNNITKHNVTAKQIDTYSPKLICIHCICSHMGTLPVWLHYVTFAYENQFTTLQKPDMHKQRSVGRKLFHLVLKSSVFCSLVYGTT